jgi:hypothetical protein
MPSFDAADLAINATLRCLFTLRSELRAVRSYCEFSLGITRKTLLTAITRFVASLRNARRDEM